MSDEWPDPDVDPAGGPDRRRLAVRLACGAAIGLVLVVLTRGFLAESLPRLWPPTEPIAQWATFVLLHGFGYVVVPLFVGSVVGDALCDRIRTTDA